MQTKQKSPFLVLIFIISSHRFFKHDWFFDDIAPGGRLQICKIMVTTHVQAIFQIEIKARKTITNPPSHCFAFKSTFLLNIDLDDHPKHLSLRALFRTWRKMNKTKRVKAFSEIEANDFVLSLEETGYKRQKRTGNKISNFVEKIVREEERKEEEVKYNLPSEIWCEIFSYFSELVSYVSFFPNLKNCFFTLLLSSMRCWDPFFLLVCYFL